MADVVLPPSSPPERTMSTTTDDSSSSPAPPCSKRSKVESTSATTSILLPYPTEIPLPSRGLIQSLYEEAVKSSSSSLDDENTNNNRHDQRYLSDAGLLSFEQVLLPALAYQEEQALKTQLQAVTQRDHPALKPAVVHTRKAVYEAVGAACRAVQGHVAAVRCPAQREREAAWRCQIQHAQEQEADRTEAARQQRKRALQKQLPANQELWREIAYLMTESGKLALEQKQWETAAVQLEQRQTALEEQEKKKEEAAAALLASSSNKNPEDDDKAKMVAPELEQVAATAAEVRVSAVRIRSALDIVRDTVQKTETARQALYAQYVRDHQFYGYQGAHDAKGLLRALSQSQPED